MDIRIVNISQGPHELNTSALKDVVNGSLTFDITSRIRYTTDQDYIGFQVDLMVMQENTQVFKSGFLIGLGIKDWAKDLKEGLDLNKDRGKLPEICEYVWMIATGIVAIQSTFKDFKGIILPKIDYIAFSKEVLLVPNEV